jgi:hypothetical protein
MARSETIISLFVASPSDVAAEREILDYVVAELNSAWSKSLAVRFELIKWETVRPGIGRYPQEVINKQIGDEYDVLVAIFWGRVGSPTPEYASGTSEEIARAISRLKTDTNLEIMVYFKDAPVSLSAIDLDQLSKLRELKKSLEQAGCLYRTFNDEANFEAMIRGNLSAVAQKFAAYDVQTRHQEISNRTVTSPNVIEDSAVSLDEEDEYGLLDYMDIFDSQMGAYNGAVSSIADATSLMGERLTKRTAQLNEIAKQAGPADRGKIRKVVELTSIDMDQYTHAVVSQVKLMRDARVGTFDALSHALSLQFERRDDDKIHELEQLDKTIEVVVNVTESALENAVAFQHTIERMPRMTVKLNRSKKEVVAATESICIEMSATIKAARDVRKVISEISSNKL